MLPVVPDMCRYKKLVLKNPTYWIVIDDIGFNVHCEVSQSRCLSNNYDHIENATIPRWFYFDYSWIKPYCWNTIQSIHIITLVEGVCAMVFNVIVIITTLRSRVLRESVAHFLVANIAVGDLLISFYMIIITSTRQSMSAENYYSMYLPYYCRIVGLFFLTGQLSSSGMSFLTTLERYLAVVYCMRPHIRITMRMSYVAMAIVWSLSLSLTVGFMTSPQFSVETDSMCLPIVNSNNEQVLYYVGGIGVFLYMIAMALYGHINEKFRDELKRSCFLCRNMVAPDP
ncbi:proteinase-activated receptor 1-like [Actinia tenebrosa]|uniref:Proteinase-activated receptor 1-like n=1 Tax=Actinia tenebrosa TaxID=6105 RepID=A0A6P8H1Y3_ACTTE|nr:proteinase-activated receptor 1-like [Actinia tenebrosa]